MKRILFIMIALISSSLLFAQPYSFSYQGIARDEKGQPYTNREVSIRLSIHDSTMTGKVLYTETRKVTTNAQGLFSVTMHTSGAQASSGNFLAISWSRGNKFLQTEIDPTGGSNFTNIGTTQLHSVPFALMSDSAARLQFPVSAIKETDQALLYLYNSGWGKGISATSYEGHTIEATSLSETGGAAVKAKTLYNNSVAIDAEAKSGLALKVSGDVQLSGGNMQPGDGKVLTSDAQGNASWQKPFTIAFRASGLLNNTNQAFPDKTWKKVLFYQTARYNYGGNYDAPNAILFPQENGIYHLNAQVYWESMKGVTYLRIMLLRNGVTSELGRDHTGRPALEDSPYQRTNRLAFDIMLQKNDAVWVEAQQANSSGQPEYISTAGQQTWFSGHLIYKP